MALRTGCAASFAARVQSTRVCSGASLRTPARAACWRSAPNTRCAFFSSSANVPSFSMTYRLSGRLRSAGICAAIIRSASSLESPRKVRRRIRRSDPGASTRTTGSNCAGSKTSNSSGMSLMAMAAPRLIALASTNHDDRTVPQRRLAVHQALVPGGRAAAYNADRLELVHHLGDAHERRHRTEGHPAEIDVGTRENDADPLVGEVVCDIDDPVIQELGFVDRDHLGSVA